MFQVSDKVVCVDDSNQDGPGDDVVKGMTYDVRGASSLGGPYLTGMSAGYFGWGEERSYRPWRFRKLSDIKAENALKNKQTEPVKGSR